MYTLNLYDYDKQTTKSISQHPDAFQALESMEELAIEFIKDKPKSEDNELIYNKGCYPTYGYYIERSLYSCKIKNRIRERNMFYINCYRIEKVCEFTIVRIKLSYDNFIPFDIRKYLLEEQLPYIGKIVNMDDDIITFKKYPYLNGIRRDREDSDDDNCSFNISTSSESEC